MRFLLFLSAILTALSGVGGGRAWATAPVAASAATPVAAAPVDAVSPLMVQSSARPGERPRERTAGTDLLVPPRPLYDDRLRV